MALFTKISTTLHTKYCLISTSGMGDKGQFEKEDFGKNLLVVMH
jgi:hypothetical protein